MKTCRRVRRDRRWCRSLQNRSVEEVEDGLGRDVVDEVHERREQDDGHEDDDRVADPRQELSDFADFLDLRRAMGGMDRQDRRLLIGHYWQDLPHSELAMQLGLAEVTVRVRLHRIRQRLRDTLMEI